jgi:hypothetical protein
MSPSRFNNFLGDFLRRSSVVGLADNAAICFQF